MAEKQEAQGGNEKKDKTRTDRGVDNTKKEVSRVFVRRSKSQYLENKCGCCDLPVMKCRNR